MARRTQPTRDHFVVVDTETTGFGPTARLVEVAAVVVVRGHVTDTFSELVNPGVPIPYPAQRVHGICDAMVCNAPGARAVLPRLLQFVAGRRLVAHNAAFDRGILTGELARNGLRSPGLPLFCSMRLARRAFPRLGSHRLDALVDALQLDAQPTHRALDDALATVEVVHACLRATGVPMEQLHGEAWEV
jgi:DNA polymerase-3 subunit epsilon